MKIVAADFDWAIVGGLNPIDKDVDHAAVVHQDAFKQKDRSSCGNGLEALENVRAQDGIDRSVFVFEADEDVAFGR